MPGLRLPLANAPRSALLDDLVRHREEQSEAYGRLARQRQSPCFAGCHGCCYQLVLIDLADALVIARRLYEHGQATAALRSALADHAELTERVPPAEYFASATGCVFLDRSSSTAACTIYDVRPNDCRAWFIHGVPDGSQCSPGAPERETSMIRDPALQEADLRYTSRWLADFLPGTGVRRPLVAWVPLSLGVLAALDCLDRGFEALATWRERLDAATRRSFSMVDAID